MNHSDTFAGRDYAHIQHPQAYATGWLRPLTCVMTVSAALLLCRSASAAMFNDPYMQGQDPQVEAVNGVYYQVQGQPFNKIHLRQSTTVAGLTTAPDQVIFIPPPTNDGLWAPEIHWLNNKWYLYYSDDSNHRRTKVAVSSGTSVTGPYTELGILWDGANGNWDGDVFTAANGSLYFVCSSPPLGGNTPQNIYICKMSNPYTLSGSPVSISAPTLSWESVGKKVNEAPYGFVRNGRTFISYSASYCGSDSYCLGLLTLEAGGNPLSAADWTKSGPVFSSAPGAYGPGSNAIFQDVNGGWWNVYHANPSPSEGCGGHRSLRIQPLEWDSNNNPSFGTPVPDNSWVSDDEGAPLNPAVVLDSSNLVQVFAANAANGSIDNLSEASVNGPFGSWTSAGGAGWFKVVGATNADGTLQLFAIGASQTVYTAWKSGGSWSSWQNLGNGGVGIADLAVILVPTSHQLELVGIGDDGCIYNNYETTINGYNNWNGFGKLDGSGGTSLEAGIAIGAEADGRLDVFWVGEQYGTLFHKYQLTGGGWSAPQNLSGNVASMALETMADGRLQLWTAQWNGNVSRISETTASNPGTWNSWFTQYTGYIATHIAFCFEGNGAGAVFFTSADGATYSALYTGVWPASATSMGGIADNVSAICLPNGLIEAFQIGTNGQLNYSFQSTLGGGFSNWTSLGGDEF